MITSQEKHIVESFASGNMEDAVELINKHYAKALYGYVIKIVQSEELTRDILQESFVKYWKNGKKYDPKKGRLFTWLLTTARNTALDKVKTKKYKASNSIQSLDLAVHDHKGKTFSTDQIGLNDFVKQLISPDKEILMLAYYDGYTQTEIADEMGIPLGTVKSKVRSSIKKLRTLMQVN